MLSAGHTSDHQNECFRPIGGGGLLIETLIHRLQGDLDTCWSGYKGLLLHERRQGT